MDEVNLQMIKKIKRIDNLAVFEKFDWDKCVLSKTGQPLSFEKINILYGRNYSGKTTLSRIFRSLETHQMPERYENPKFELDLNDNSIINQDSIASNSLNVRVFNEDFINENLNFLNDPNSGIAPFAILGANNAEIERNINVLKKEIGSESLGQETGLYLELKTAKHQEEKAKSRFNVLKDGLESKLSDKALNRRTGIKYNIERFGDQNYNTMKLKRDIGVVNGQSFQYLSLEKKAEFENTIREQNKAKIQPLNIPSLKLKIYHEKAKILLSQPIGSQNKIAELLLDAALNSWVKLGAPLLEGKNTCAFCGNFISKERWVKIHNHFDEESSKLETEIDILLSEMNSERELVQTKNNIDKTAFYVKYYKDVDDFMSLKSKAEQDYLNILDSIIEQLQTRKAQITVPIQLNTAFDNSEVLNRLYINFNEIINESNEYSSKLASAKATAQKKLLLQEVKEFCNTIGYDSLIQRIDGECKDSELTAEVSVKLGHLLNTKIQEMQNQFRQLNDEEEGARRINKYLNDYFGHNFVTLVAERDIEGEKKIKFRIMRNDKPAFNLSGGERSLISFCYFMAKLDDVDTNGKKPIIWIDDPISSLDSNHIYFMYSLIVAVIAKTGNFEQLYISTHNLDFLKYLRRLNSYQPGENNKQSSVSKGYFLIERVGKVSRIIKMPKYLSNNATEFNYLFSAIYKCSQCESVTDDNYDILHSFGNNARKFLELLLFFYYPDDSEDLLPKLKLFFETEEIPPILMDRVFNEGSHSSSLERASNLFIDPETIPVAKKIIEKLSENRVQFNALLKSVDECVTS